MHALMHSPRNRAATLLHTLIQRVRWFGRAACAVLPPNAANTAPAMLPPSSLRTWRRDVWVANVRVRLSKRSWSMNGPPYVQYERQFSCASGVFCYRRGVLVGLGVLVGALVGVGVHFIGWRLDGMQPGSGVGVIVGVAVLVGVFVGVFVAVLAGVAVLVGIFVGVFVGGTGVLVGVSVSVGVLVGGTGVLVGVFVGVEQSSYAAVLPVMLPLPLIVPPHLTWIVPLLLMAPLLLSMPVALIMITPVVLLVKKLELVTAKKPFELMLMVPLLVPLVRKFTIRSVMLMVPLFWKLVKISRSFSKLMVPLLVKPPLKTTSAVVRSVSPAATV